MSMDPFADDETSEGARFSGTGSPPASDTSNEDFLFHLYRGSELLQDNRVHEAKEELERALHLQPRDTKGQDLLGLVYFRLGLYPRAIAIYEQLRRTSPRDTALLLNLSLCYLKTGQPGLARRELEALLALNPRHVRGWGYLGLACERLGDLEAAERAFAQGGHGQMARRIAQRQSLSAPAAPPADERTEEEAREVVAAAFEELDAGELSFAIAEQASPGSNHDDQGDRWRSIELGHAGELRGDFPAAVTPATAKPDTRDGPPPAPSLPHLGQAATLGRTPTLIAPAPTSHDPLALPFDKHPSPRPPAIGLDEPGAIAASSRRPFYSVPQVTVGTRPSLRQVHEHKKTLPPPGARPGSAPPPGASELAQRSAALFPRQGSLVVHPSGLALVRTSETGFAARLEAMRATSNGLEMKVLERYTKGKPTGESFGGATSPVVRASGDGQLVLGARAGFRVSSFVLEDEMCFVREEVLLGFDFTLAFENGRMSSGEGEVIAIVQLRGRGAVLVETKGEILTLDVQASRGLSVRREVVLGWFGRLVPRALPASEAPCGQRGLVSFAGEGRVLVASG
jgi:uncharacterized protein (AIM24 family)